jgi:hypothetical protein
LSVPDFGASHRIAGSVDHDKYFENPHSAILAAAGPEEVKRKGRKYFLELLTASLYNYPKSFH